MKMHVYLYNGCRSRRNRVSLCPCRVAPGTFSVQCNLSGYLYYYRHGHIASVLFMRTHHSHRERDKGRKRDEMVDAVIEMAGSRYTEAYTNIGSKT